MSLWSSIAGVGANPHVVGHYGAAVNQARAMGLPSDVVEHVLNEYKDLTSALPPVAGMLKGVSGGVNEAEARGHETYTAPNRAGPGNARG